MSLGLPSLVSFEFKLLPGNLSFIWFGRALLLRKLRLQLAHLGIESDDLLIELPELLLLVAELSGGSSLTTQGLVHGGRIALLLKGRKFLLSLRDSFACAWIYVRHFHSKILI